MARRVEHLEARLGVRLFDRLARGWALTGEGAALRERAEAVELEVLALERAAAGVESLAGVVTVSAPPVLLSRPLEPALQRPGNHAAGRRGRPGPGPAARLRGARRAACLGCRRCRGGDPAWVRPVCQVMHPDLRRARRVRLLADWIVAHWARVAQAGGEEK